MNGGQLHESKMVKTQIFNLKKRKDKKGMHKCHTLTAIFQNAKGTSLLFFIEI